MEIIIITLITSVVVTSVVTLTLTIVTSVKDKARYQLLGGTSHQDYFYLSGGTSAQNYSYLLDGTSSQFQIMDSAQAVCSLRFSALFSQIVYRTYLQNIQILHKLKNKNFSDFWGIVHLLICVISKYKRQNSNSHSCDRCKDNNANY